LKRQGLGSDHFEPDVLCHQTEIGVMVDDLKPVFGTECADQHVDRLSDRYALRPQSPVVG
jgi:hypothetical protein